MKSFLSRTSNLYALLKVFLEDPVFMSLYIYLKALLMLSVVTQKITFNKLSVHSTTFNSFVGL